MVIEMSEINTPTSQGEIVIYRSKDGEFEENSIVRKIRTTATDEKSYAVNHYKYEFKEIEQAQFAEMSDDEKIDFVAARILKKYKPAFLELAK